MGIFEYARRTSLQPSPSEPTEAPIVKQLGDYRRYPYTQMTLPRSSPVRSRDASAFPIGRWAELPRVA